MKNVIRKVFGMLIAVVAIGAVSAQARKVEVWDFGGVQAKDAVNHISVTDFDNADIIGTDGKFTGGELVFGDLTLNTDKNDRAYYNGKKNYGDQGYTSFDFKDGYLANGIYYANGKGGEKKRYMLLKNVRAGDTITFYARISNSGDETIHFASVNADGTKNGKQDEVAPLGAVSKKYQYIANTDGAYKIYADANVGKPVYYRLVRTPCVEVSGSLSGLPAGKAELKFIEKDSKLELPAKISGKSYSAGLAAGHTYTAVLTGIKGYGVNSYTKVVELKPTQTGSFMANLTVAEQKTYKISGNVTGIAADYKNTDMKVLFTPPAGTTYLPAEARISGADGKYTYTGDLEPSVIYTATLVGANDYEIKTGGTAEGTEDITQDITVALKPQYEVQGSFFGAANPLPTAISFKNIEDGYEYSGTVSGNAYSAKLRDGSYEVTAATDKASTMNHIVVDGKAVSKNIKLTAKDKTVQPQKLKKDIYVGGKKADYATIKEAVEAASAMKPASENDRITIHIAPGTYRAQLIITTPYLTLKNDTPEQEVKLTWYYGIGYLYYSADEKGFYNEDLAYDKFSKKGAARWGCATRIMPSAKGFKAEGITFETSFNKYVTDEEIADGVENDGSIQFVRKLNSDVRSKKATERAAALCSEADEAEFYRCKFLGLQDTLYTGADTRQYFRNCFIEGNTDFIFGDGDVVFENCEIRWAGYTDVKVAGYLTAARNALSKGYLFYNCVISADNAVYQNPGVFGRPWGPKASVAWVNTILGTDNVIDPMGWTDMSGNLPKNANFAEFNSLWNGKAVPTNERKGGVLSSASGYEPKDYLAGWKQVYAGTQSVSKLGFSKKPSFTTDDDINTPYPGHTITLHYSLGKADSEDMSLIQWYRDGKLVKQSAGYADKTYFLTKDDTGATITATVTPKTRDGSEAKPLTAKLDAKVKEGFSVPSKAAADRPRAIGKVNVFLAGDSTVKDYSAEGMWSGGKTRNEGAWGEFLQAWFNDTVSVQNYANGGRSTRNFINEGSLDKIAEKIGKGDYLFIQFGHNDCSNGQGYLEDRYVPLGEPNKKGIYPIAAGKKVPTPASYSSKYGPQFYSYDCGGTYKWYLKQYIDVAKKAGATPVLITPVSRVYFAGMNGKIEPHHDSKDTTTKTQVTKNNAYVEAVRQLAKEEKVLLIDGFELSKLLYEKSYADTKKQDEAFKLMFTGDKTHNNKLGGFILAGEIAKAIKTTIPALAGSIVHPKKAIGENSDGKLMFTVDSEGKIECESAYWKNYAQNLMDSMSKKK
ncbi:MAG: hypothetical protein IJP62_13625 [Treponema sp.]|nr:hypothetical protein [Treponema sp.]